MRPDTIKTIRDERGSERLGDREISLGPNTIPIWESLLMAHARGEVLFIVGAGASKSSGLPEFRKLVLDVYQVVDSAVWEVLKKLPPDACSCQGVETADLNDDQRAEVRRFVQRDYDLVLGMLERRMDSVSSTESAVRNAIRANLAKPGAKPAAIHKALIRLASFGSAARIVTTNFDVLLEEAARQLRQRLPSLGLGSIPQVSSGGRFAGVMHIHGRIPRSPRGALDIVVTDQDFGQHYLRGRTIADFIFDAARLFSLVLVGYSAADPPMRYLLHAVAADGQRFSDLKPRYAFIGTTKQQRAIEMADWKARGITPILYSNDDGHIALTQTLVRWADFARIDVKQKRLDAELAQLVRKPYKASARANRHLFDHIVRRSPKRERSRIAEFISGKKADLGWLDAALRIERELLGGGS